MTLRMKKSSIFNLYLINYKRKTSRGVSRVRDRDIELTDRHRQQDLARQQDHQELVKMHWHVI